jgi:four helix bundle protein
MQNPDNLRVAPAAEDLAVLVYEYTSEFPASERFGLAFQLRRTAVSIGSSIFEGAGRRTNKQFAASLVVSHGEACELGFQVRLAQRLNFGDRKLGSKVRRSQENVRRMLFNLIDSVEAEISRVEAGEEKADVVPERRLGRRRAQ